VTSNFSDTLLFASMNCIDTYHCQGWICKARALGSFRISLHKRNWSF